jgi:hypothetical protein
MKNLLTIFLLVIMVQVIAQNYPITGVNISLPSPPDASLRPVITSITPSSNRPPTSNRPTFEWKTQKKEEGLSYSIVVREIPEVGAPESGRIIFERGGIRENIFSYPQDAPSLVAVRNYGWKVNCFKDGKLVASSPFTPFNQTKAPGNLKVTNDREK